MSSIISDITSFQRNNAISLIEFKDTKVTYHQMLHIGSFLKYSPQLLSKSQKDSINKMFHVMSVDKNEIQDTCSLLMLRTNLLHLMLSEESTHLISSRQEEIEMEPTFMKSFASTIPLYLKETKEWCILINIKKDKGMLMLNNPFTNDIVHLYYEDALEWTSILLLGLDYVEETMGNKYKISPLL